MTTETDDGKFLRILTNEFVPLKLPDDYSISHKECHPLLENKSHEGFYNMVASGQVEFCMCSDQQEVGKMYIEPEIRMGNSVILFHSLDMFLTPPVTETRIEAGLLEIRLDLRIDLKRWIRPSQMQEFLSVLSSGGITDIGWDYNCTLIEGGKKTSRRLCKQEIGLYKLARYKTKKEILAAE